MIIDDDVFRSQAYGVLDKYKISKTFFVKTDQADCAYLDTLVDENDEAKKTKKKPQETKTGESTKSAIPVKEDDVETKKVTETETLSEKASLISDAPKVIEEVLEVETVPERILKIAEVFKEDSADNKDKLKQENAQPEENIAGSVKEEKNEHPKETEKTA